MKTLNLKGREMEDRIKTWHDEITEITGQFIDNFKSLNEEQMNLKPNSKSWSIGQVIEHLIKTTENYSKIPIKIRCQDFNPSILTHISFLPKLYGRMLLKYVEPERKRKINTFKIFEPEKSDIDINILSEFEDSQNKLHSFIDENLDLVSNSAIIPSPISNHIFYHFDTVIDILINHQKRHLNQALNVLELISKELSS